MIFDKRQPGFSFIKKVTHKSHIDKKDFYEKLLYKCHF